MYLHKTNLQVITFVTPGNLIEPGFVFYNKSLDLTTVHSEAPKTLLRISTNQNGHLDSICCYIKIYMLDTVIYYYGYIFNKISVCRWTKRHNTVSYLINTIKQGKENKSITVPSGVLLNYI